MRVEFGMAHKPTTPTITSRAEHVWIPAEFLHFKKLRALQTQAASEVQSQVFSSQFLVLRYFWWKQIQRSSWVFLGRFVHVKHVDFYYLSCKPPEVLEHSAFIPLLPDQVVLKMGQSFCWRNFEETWKRKHRKKYQKIIEKPGKKKLILNPMKRMTKKNDGNFTEPTSTRLSPLCLRSGSVLLWQSSSSARSLMPQFSWCYGVFGSWEPLRGTNHQEKMHGKKLENCPISYKMYPCFCFMNIQYLRTPSDRRSRGATLHTATSWRQNTYIQPGTPTFVARIWTHPIETTIYKCLFQVLRMSKSKIAFMDSNWYFSIQGIQVLLFCYINYLRSFTLWRQKNTFFSQSFMFHPHQFYRVITGLHLQNLLLTSLFGSSPFLFLLLARPPAPRRTSLDPFVDVETSEPPGRISFIQCGFYDIKILGQRLQH